MSTVPSLAVFALALVFSGCQDGENAQYPLDSGAQVVYDAGAQTETHVETITEIAADAGAESPAPDPVTWNAFADSAANTTVIHFHFSAPVESLATQDIVVTEGTGALARAGALVGSADHWVMPVCVTEAGSVSVWIDRSGVEGAAVEIEVGRMPLPASWAAASAGRWRTVAIGADGSLWAWGWDLFWQPNEGGIWPFSFGEEYNFRAFPTRIGARYDWAALCDAGNYAINADGSLWALRRDGLEAPIRLGSSYDWARVSSGWGHTAAIKTDGSLWTWGANTRGQLGDGTGGGGYGPMPMRRDEPERIAGDNTWICVSTGNATTLAIRADGSLWGWGNNWDGMINGDPRSGRDLLYPQRLGGDYGWELVSATNHGIGLAHLLAMKTDGSIWEWGVIMHRSESRSFLPARTGTVGRFSEEWSEWSDWYLGSPADYVWRSAVASGPHLNHGFSSVAAIRDDGSLWGWTWPFEGSVNMLRVGADYDWAFVGISKGFAPGGIGSQVHRVAIKTDGSLWTWGNNDFGQLGNGASGWGAGTSIPGRVQTW